MTVLNVVISLLAIGIGWAVVAAAFVAVVRLSDRRLSAEGFITDHISENADVAAIQADLPEMPRWNGWRQ